MEIHTVHDKLVFLHQSKSDFEARPHLRVARCVENTQCPRHHDFVFTLNIYALVMN